MKTKMFLLAAAMSSGFTLLSAQDAPKPPPGGPGGEGRPGGPGGDPQARFDEIYIKMDLNKDGKVTKEEFLAFSKQEAEDRFSKMDASGSGAISKEQIAEAMRRMRGGDGGQGQRRPEGFRRPEGEGGGTRPRPGGDNSAPSGNPPPPPAEGSPGGPGGPGGPGMRGGGMGGQSAMGEVFRKVQEGGSVSKEEFAKMSEDGFKRLDANGDGKITKEDLEALRSKMGAGPGGAPGDAPKGGGGFRRPPGGDGGASGDKPKRPASN
jgi:Ca2+-binding EF-hand superfamily protein